MKVTPEVLNELRKGVVLTGTLSEVHINTLKSAPYIYFDSIDSVHISYDLITEHENAINGLGSKVVFTLTLLEPDQEFMEQRLQALVNTVHVLLWPEVEVVIQDQDRNVLKSSKSNEEIIVNEQNSTSE